jgi:MATE family, multidrug efflux pump
LPFNKLREIPPTLVGFFDDREYYRRLIKIGVPIAVQQLIMSSLNMVGVVMIGQLGAAPLAAVGLANQIFFLLNLVLFAIGSGSAMFTAQLWGIRDIRSIRKVLGLALTLGLLVAMFFLVIAELLPEQVLSIYSKDPVVIALGSDYLRIIGFSFILYAISFCFSSVLRSTGDVKTPLIVTITSLSFNVLLSYTLIFGIFGFPSMGVNGAAIAVICSRILECTLLLILTYRKHSPAAGKLKELFSYDRVFALRVLKPIMPVLGNEILWSLGVTAYSVIYARMGTYDIAAMNIVASIDQVAFVIFYGIGHACAIMVGHRIGEGLEELAFRYAARSEVLAMLGGVVIGSIILLSRNMVLSLYNVPLEVIYYSYYVLTIVGLVMWLRASNMVLFVGIFRSGGDTRFAFLLDGVIIWVVGVPLAFIAAFVLYLPVYWVYLFVMSEEIAKWILGMYRFISRKWIHNLAQTVGD